MPNHVKNRLEIVGSEDQVKEVVKAFGEYHPAELYRAYDGSIICRDTAAKDPFSVGWFNEKTGMFKRRGESDVLGLPEGWEMEIEEAFNHFPDFEKVIPQPENIFNGDLGRKEEEMCKREGRPTWYDWNPENWGTKWNSYCCEQVSNNVFEFETAWSGVPKIVEAISKKFPELEFNYAYASEDTGCNTGRYTLKNGITSEYHPKNYSVEAYDLAFELRPHYKEDYKLVDGEYQYVEEEEDE